MTSNTDLDAFRDLMLADIAAKKQRREKQDAEKKQLIVSRPDAPLSTQPERKRITAAQQVWGIAEIRENIFFQMDPMDLLNKLHDSDIREQVHASKPLRLKVYREQLPEIPLVPLPRSGLKRFQVNIWEPNRILLPTDDSEFVFTVAGMDDLVFTLRMATRTDYVGPHIPGLYDPADYPHNFSYRVLELHHGPLHPAPEGCEAMPARAIKTLVPPVTRNPPVSWGVLNTMLTDRATTIRVVIVSDHKTLHGQPMGCGWFYECRPGTMLKDVVRAAGRSSEKIMHWKRQHEEGM